MLGWWHYRRSLGCDCLGAAASWASRYLAVLEVTGVYPLHSVSTRHLACQSLFFTELLALVLSHGSQFKMPESLLDRG